MGECAKYAWAQSTAGEAGCYSTLGGCDWGECVGTPGYCFCPADTCADNVQKKCVPRSKYMAQELLSEVEEAVETKSFAMGFTVASISLFSMGVLVMRSRKMKGT